MLKVPITPAENFKLNFEFSQLELIYRVYSHKTLRETKKWILEM